MVYVKYDNGFYGVYSSSPISKGLIVYGMSPTGTHDKPTRTSIQIDESVHIEDSVGRYINHACNPTVRIDGLSVIAVRDIKTDEEITFNYMENESIMANPFKCSCCGKWIGGKDFEKDYKKRLAILDELTELSQEMGLYDELKTEK